MVVDKFMPVDRLNFRCAKKSEPILLLSGPPSSGKTSLLFQCAYNTVTESEGDVVFICNRRKLETKPPFLAQGIDPSSDIFQRIQMKYLEDEEGIKKYFAAFHMHDPAPVSVIIDDFAEFFDEGNCQERYNNPRGRDLAMVRILALCQNAIIYAIEKGQCQLLLSDTHHGDSPRLLYIYKRWISSIYTIKGDGFGSYLLRGSNNMGVAKSESTRTIRTAKYSIALQYLILEGITEDEEQSGG